MSESSGRKPETHTEAFTEIYKKERWGKGKGSGTGSDPKYCKKYMEYLERDLRADHFEQVIDFGSGDWQFSRHVDWSSVDYIGIEAVEHIFDPVQAQFQISDDNGDWRVAFVNEDFSHPGVVRTIVRAYNDKTCLILVKDVLQHWEDVEVAAFLDAIYDTAKSGDSLLITNNWRFIRAPKPIPNPRVLDRYRWCPIDFTELKWRRYNLEPVLYYPRKEKVVMRRDF